MLSILLFIIVSAITIWLVWRIASRRSSLPCPSWLAWLVELENPFAKKFNTASVIEHLALRQGMRVLDAGCGPGRVTIPLAQAVGLQGEVTAVDIQSAMLQRAQQKAREANVKNIRFINAGLGEGKLESNCFNRAVMVTVLGEIPDRVKALKEIFNALKPGGILSVTEIIFDPHYQSRKTVLRLTEEAGFKEHSFSGNWSSFTLNMEKTENG